jgi:hypothetical protein
VELVDAQSQDERGERKPTGQPIIFQKVMAGHSRDIRLTPESGHSSRDSAGSFGAKAGQRLWALK